MQIELGHRTAEGSRARGPIVSKRDTRGEVDREIEGRRERVREGGKTTRGQAKPFDPHVCPPRAPLVTTQVGQTGTTEADLYRPRCLGQQGRETSVAMVSRASLQPEQSIDRRRAGIETAN